MNMPVFDLHCDTALALLGESFREHGALRRNKLHFDLERAGANGGFCQCFACFTTPLMEDWGMPPAEEMFQRELEHILGQLEENRDLIRLAYTAGDVTKNLNDGKMSAILTIEGPAGFGYDPALLEDLYHAGFRITTLGWNERNVLTGSHLTGGGLTDLGREYVREAQRLGMVIDVSHISDEGFWDLMEISEKPIVATHSNSRALCDHSRNLTDDMFLAICRTGGVAGFNQCADFVGGAEDLDAACRHFLHFLELDPDGEHIALGGDLDGCDRLTAGFTGVESYPALAQCLLDRGVSLQILRKIFWENSLGVMEKCCT